MTGTWNQHFWTPEEDAQLRALLPEGISYDEIAERMGLTPGQIIGRRARLKLHKKPSRFNEHFWTPEQDARMRALRDEGHPASEIARRMGMTKNAIMGRLHRSGMCRRNMPQPPWDNLDLFHYLMNLALAESAAIPRLPVPERSNTGNGRRAVLGGFGSRSLGYDQRDYDALARSTGISR